MSAAFPNSPATGDSYTFQGRTYTYTSDGAWKAMVGIGNILAIQVFTTTGGVTYTPTSGMVYAHMKAVGGGGGGGGAAGGNGSTTLAVGESGGGGGTAEAIVSAAQVGSSQTVTIGIGGTGGTAGNNAGNAGGTTSVGSLVSAAGGGAGSGGAAAAVVQATGHAGGTPTIGNVALIVGGPPGVGCGVAGQFAYSGAGGSSTMGGGAVGQTVNSAGVTATGYGGGGSGGVGTTANTTARAGGDGFKGIVIITEYCNAGSALYGIAPGALWGLTLSNNGSDATNDIDIAAGIATDSTNTDYMKLTSSITKQLDATWAVGTNAGGLDTGSIANTTYHVWLIKRPDTGVVDVLYSTSATSPTMPANYTLKRRIGSIIRASAAIKTFTQYGDDFILLVPILDASNNTLSTSAVSYTLTVPAGIKVKAMISGFASFGNTNHGILVSSLDQTDTAPSATAGPFTAAECDTSGISSRWSEFQTEVWTNTSSQVRARVTGTVIAGSPGFALVTWGWRDYRGRLA